jgi:hypothetical protein
VRIDLAAPDIAADKGTEARTAVAKADRAQIPGTGLPGLEEEADTDPDSERPDPVLLDIDWPGSVRPDSVRPGSGQCFVLNSQGAAPGPHRPEDYCRLAAPPNRLPARLEDRQPSGCY